MRLIREALQPPRMRRVGTPAVGDPVRPHAAISEVHQVKPRRTRRKREIRDADNVPVADAVLMSLQSIQRTPQQTGINRTTDTVCSPESELCSQRPRSKAGKGKIDKKTARKYQDIQLRCK